MCFLCLLTFTGDQTAALFTVKSFHDLCSQQVGEDWPLLGGTVPSVGSTGQHTSYNHKDSMTNPKQAQDGHCTFWPTTQV